MKLAVGFFDGVHLGHRLILAEADAALTFKNHPHTILAPDKTPPLIMSLFERLSLVSSILCLNSQGSDPTGSNKGLAPQAGSDPTGSNKGLAPQAPQAGSDPTNSQGSDPTLKFERVCALDFTEEMSRITPEGFIDFLREMYPDLDTIRCGPNWKFGASGVGDAEFARKMGLVVEEVPFVSCEGMPVSSTRIRKSLAEGDIRMAARMLGREWSVTGKVFSGKGAGRKIGFPTLNIRPYVKFLPLRNGVYAVNTEWGQALANWGVAPTMGEKAWNENVLEVHLLSVPENFSTPDELKVTFIEFVRPERKFASPEDLARQIAEDIEGCKKSLMI